MIDIFESKIVKEKLEKYANLLLEWNEKFNLTAITNKDEIRVKHFIDSIYVCNFVLLEKGSLIDVGSGAGFPGIPLAIYNPNLKVTLLESNGKKVTFLNAVKEALDLNNVTVVLSRAEDAKNLSEKFDFVTARAVKELNILVEICGDFLKIGGHMLAYKGSDSDREIDNAKHAFKILNLEIEKQFKYNLPESNDPRTLIYIKKTKSFAKKYPRNYSEIAKFPL